MILQQTEWPERCNPRWLSDRIKGESPEKIQNPEIFSGLLGGKGSQMA
jgi:hypothetical protein